MVVVARGGLPLADLTVKQVSYADFKQGHRGGNGGQEHQEIEEESHKGTAEASHTGHEDLVQRHEEQRGTAGRGEAEGEARRHDNHTGQNRHDGVGQRDDIHLPGEILLLRQV